MNPLLEIYAASAPGRLAGVTLTLAAGTLTGLVGPNGSGKSTLLQIAAGVLPAATGRIVWSGRDIGAIDAAERGRLAAWVPQTVHFEFGFSVASVVAQGRFAHSDDGAGVAEALARFDLTALANRPVTQLSGGERERVLLARALATRAPLQLWDEPLAPLDPRHALETLALARELAANGAAVLLSLHDLALAHELDNLAVLHQGHLQATGTPAEILTPALLLEVFGVEAAMKQRLAPALPHTPLPPK
jgi:iron complex transport system ATP-binding protein